MLEQQCSNNSAGTIKRRNETLKINITMEATDCLDVASRIGRRLVRQALWDGSECTWEVRVPDYEKHQENQFLTTTAGGLLYQGSAGIALFLGELRRVTGDLDLDKTLSGAMHHALRAGHELPAGSCGFHSGRVGIAYVAARLGTALGESGYLDAARQLLEPLPGTEASDSAFDVIGGAAGAIPGLLELADMLGGDLPVDIATALGDSLIDKAHRETDGWSWKTVQDGAVRHLTGLAHGTAGIGLALLELAHATGNGRYLFAAEMAFLYERQHYDAEASNWPDFRNQKILDARFYNRIEELREAVRDVGLPAFEPICANAWCHGAPGMGLSRLRAFALTGQARYQEEALAALDSTQKAVLAFDDNFSLCHGLAGNCELLVEALATLEAADPAWQRTIDLCCRYGWESFESAERPWPSGTLDLAPEPSLMLGEAGIGLFYLRQADPQVPSILVLHPKLAKPGRAGVDEGYETLLDETVEGYFGQTRRVFQALGADLPKIRQLTAPIDDSPVALAEQQIRQALERTEQQDHLVDAASCELQRYALSRELADYTVEYLRGLIRPPESEVDRFTAPFRLADDCRFLTTRWDWPGWLEAREDNATQEGEPDEDECACLLFRRSNQIHIQPLGALAAIVLEALTSAISGNLTHAELCEHVAAAIGSGGQSDRQRLGSMVERQLTELYRAGFIEVHRVAGER